MRSRDADPTHDDYLAGDPPRFRGFDRRSFHLPVRDGTKLAIDVCLPRGLGVERVPTIVRTTRYFRRFRLARPLRSLPDAALDPLNGPLRALFTAHGYAWIDVDARGSGASFGWRPCPWWRDGEVRDGLDLVEWIVRQPWSNGLVGATGVSYDGTAAEFLAVHGHPAVRAVAPRFSCYDVYADIGFPGGLHLAWFTENWARANAALDRNEPHAFIRTVLGLRVMGAKNARVAERGTLPNALANAFQREGSQRALAALLRAALAGVAPVDDDRDAALVREAIASHARNYSVHEGALETTFRDDVPPSTPVEGSSVDAFSPSTYAKEFARSGTAFLGESGWSDGAYANAAIKRHRALGGGAHELVIGPWVHGGLLDLDPEAPSDAAAFDHGAELLRFFDRHLRPRANEPPRAPVRYYMMGEGRWRHASEWPPKEARTRVLHLARGRRLADAPGARDVDVHDVDPRAGTGRRTRWETLLSPFVHADGARLAPTLLAYESDPLERALHVVGHPVVELCMSSSVEDGALFAYLSDVAEDGRARTITEGNLRTIHATKLHDGDVAHVEASYLARDARRVPAGTEATHAIELLPTAFVFRRGHRLRLTLAGADVDHFRAVGEGRVGWRIVLGASRLLLPVIPRPA